MKHTALTDSGRPLYRDYFKRHIFFWAYPLEALCYDFNARPLFVVATCAIFVASAIKGFFLASVLVIVLLNILDSRKGYFPYRPRSEWSQRQEEAYLRYVSCGSRRQ